MNSKENGRRRRGLRNFLVSAAAAAGLGAAALGIQTASVSAQSDNFRGGSPEISQTPDMRSVRIRFPAGVRSSWHTHTWGQLLMIEEGVGLHQIRGRTIEEMRPGEPWWTPAGVEHWHGAHPDADALQLTIYEGGVEWLEPVADEQYLGARIRPPARAVP